MANLRELRYYRGSYNPSTQYRQAGDAYQSVSGADSGIISMYNPEQEGQFIDAISQRQGRFDTANLAQQQERIRIGETETYDLSELNNRLKSFESGINSVVKDKYNGDYGAAANEIAKMIGTERTNPFYHFNKQKVEAGKTYLDAKVKLGANFLTAGNPMNVSFQDWQKGQTFEFTPINKDDIVRAAQAVGQNFSKMVTSDSGLQLTPDGQYFKNTVQYGIKDLSHLEDFIAKSGIDQQIYESMPELQGVENQDAVQEAIRTGLTSAIGMADTRYMANQGYLNDAQIAGMNKSGSAGGGQGKVVTLGYIEGPKSVTTGKPIAIPIHALNPMYGTTVGEGSEIDRNMKGVDEYLTKFVQTGDITGMTSEDSRLLKDIDIKKLTSFSLIPTTDPRDVTILNLNIMGTPGKTKNNRTPVPVPISTKVVDPADKVNILTQLSILDPRVFATYMDQLKEVNPTAWADMDKAINESKTK